MTNPPDPSPLDYQTPAASQPLSVWKVLAGVVSAAAIIAITVALSMMYLGLSGFLIIAGVVVGLVVLAISMKRKPHGRSFAIGLWIGIGVALLMEGLCWVMLDRALRS